MQPTLAGGVRVARCWEAELMVDVAWWPRLALAVRGCLVVLWLIWAVLAWWSAPRPADVDQAHRDIAAGEVTSVDTGTHWRNGPFWGNTPTLEGGPDGALVAWTTTSDRTRYTEDGPGPSFGQTRFPGSGDPPQFRPLVAELQEAADFRYTRSDIHWLNLLATSVMGIFLLALIAGPAPIRSTRWYWFWISLIPFGLGVLTWVLRERWLPGPGTALTQRLVGIDGGVAKKRPNGFEGFLLMIVAGIALSFATYGLRQLLGYGLVPG